MRNAAAHILNIKKWYRTLDLLFYTIVKLYNDAETGKLINSVIDKNGEKVYNTNYSYDFKGNIVNETRDGSFALTKEFVYTDDNDLEKTKYAIGGQSLIYEYETDNTPDKRNTKVTLPFNVEQKFAYDGLGRINLLKSYIGNFL